MHTREHHVKIGDFPAGLLAKTPHFQYRGLGSTPGQGTQIPHSAWCRQKIKNKQTNSKNNMESLRNCHSQEAWQEGVMTTEYHVSWMGYWKK